MLNFGLVVIGAHTGEHITDLINNHAKQKILLVEPVPYNYDILEKKFKDIENIFICNKAIFDQRLKNNFYFVKKDSITKLEKHWASQIGSFDKNHILNHKNKRFDINDEDIESIEVDFITFEDLIKTYSIKKIEKLQIDAEGAEYKIMKSINYELIPINKILFESKHFDGTFKEGKKLDEIKKKLLFNGYNLEQVDKENILASK